MSTPVISVRNVSKRYQLGAVVHDTLRDHVAHGMRSLKRLLCSRNGEAAGESADSIWAVQDVSFDVRQGDVVGIIGRNGAGKSTLLKILSRITEPTSGEIHVRGRVASLLEVGTGFHPELTGRENIFLNGAILGMARAEIRRKFDEIVAFAEVERFLDTPVKRYSSGMYVRLAFAVAAYLEPEILVVDEVLAVGDVAFQAKCLNKMQDVATREGRTILFVSHNLAAVQRLCTRGILLKAGRLEFDGPVDHCIVRYREEVWSDTGEDACFKVNRDLLNTQTKSRVRIGDIELLNAGCAPLRSLHSTDGLVIRLRYRADPQFARVPVAFRVSIKTHMAQEICRFSTMPISGYPIEELGEGGHVDLKIPALPLTAGRYFMDVAISRPNVEALVKLEDVVAFRVEGKDVYNSGMFLDHTRGVVVLPHAWSQQIEAPKP